MRTAAELVKGAKQKRIILDFFAAAEQAIIKGGDEAQYATLLDQIQTSLSNLDHAEADDAAAQWDNAFDAWEAEIENPQEIVTIPTPWDDLNDILTGGLKSSRLYTFGARPGDGKSIAILNVAEYAAQQGFGVAVFSLELDKHEVMSRMIAAGARADYGQITRGQIDQYNRDLIREYREQMQGQNLVIVDKPEFSLDQLARQCRALKRTNAIDLIVVDYLQIITGDPRLPRIEQLRRISWGLKSLAKELRIPIVTAAQLNRNAATDDKRPTKNELRESGSIENDSDAVILLYHELFQGRKQTGEIELIVDKNRVGREGVVTEFWVPHRARIGK